MSVNYTPVTYLDGSVRTGAEQSDQESRIDTAVGVLEGAGYIAGENIHALYSEVLAIKGAGGAPIKTLIQLNTLLTTGSDPGHAHTGYAASAHTHVVADITNLDANYASQTEFNALAGAGWTTISGISVMGHETEINTAQADIVAMKGSGWTTESIRANYLLITTGASPGHDHVVADLTDAATLATVAQLDALKGAGWTVSETVHAIYLLLTTGTSPGHLHSAADITGLSGTYATIAQLDAVKGAGWTSAMTVKGHDDAITAVKGVGWTSAMTLAAHDTAITAMKGVGWTSAMTLAAHDTDISTLQDEMLDIQGTGYTKTISDLTQVTGVSLTYPTANGSPEGSYNLVFTYVSPLNHTLSWGGGAAITLNANGTFPVYDASATTYVNATIVLANLPTSSKTDTGVQVFPQAVSDLYSKFNSLILSDNTQAHVIYSHGDGLIAYGTVAVTTGMTLSYSGVKANIGGSVVSVTDSTIALNRGDLTASQAKIALISVNNAGTVAATYGTIFLLSAGRVFYPSVPSNSIAIRYVLVSGNRDLVNSDIIDVKVIADFAARWPLISKALAVYGTSIDQELGFGVENPHSVTGVMFSPHRLFTVTQPTVNFTLSELNDTDAHISYYNTSPAGTYAFTFTTGTNEITWGGGTAVVAPGSVGETVVAYDSSGITGILVTRTGSLPVSNVNETMTVGERAIPGIGRYTVAFVAGPPQTISIDSGAATDISAGGFFHIPVGTSGHYLGAYVSVANLPTVDTNDKVRVYWNGLTELDMKIFELSKLLNDAAQPIPFKTYPASALELAYYDPASNTGVLSDGVLTSPNWKAYKQWESSETSGLQEVRLFKVFKLLEDFVGFDSDSSAAVTITYSTEGTSTTNNRLDVNIYKRGSASAVYTSNNNFSTPGSHDVETLEVPQSSMTGFLEGDQVVVELSLFSKSDSGVRVYDVDLRYKTA